MAPFPIHLESLGGSRYIFLLNEKHVDPIDLINKLSNIKECLGGDK